MRLRRSSSPGGLHETDRSLLGWTAALYLCIALTMSVVLGTAIWGVYHDLRQVRQTFISSEMERLRSHAERTVVRIEEDARKLGGGLDQRFAKEGSLRQHWQRMTRTDESRLYAAIVDPTGLVFMHSDPRQQGGRLGPVWYDSVVPEAGDDVVDTRAAALTGGGRAFDVRVPIMQDGQLLGTYHSGLHYTWLESELAEGQAATMRLWCWILGFILVAVVVAGLSLLQISRRIATLRERVKLVQVRRFAELGQLMAGIVHEIRNPLNAMRLNLHVLSRQLPHGDADEHAAVNQAQIIQETNQEIERVEGLMRILLGYARPDQPQPDCLDVRHEVEGVLQFLKPVLERAEMAVTARFTETPLFVHMDRDRLRQIMINLLNNAKEATGPGGHVELAVTANRDEALITVADNGPGVPPPNRERIFDPFFSTKEEGTGLGLALVRRFVEEIGGSVSCEKNDPSGARFHLRLPRAAVSQPLHDANLSSTR